MSDYFTKLAAKTVNTTPMVRPNLHSWFGAPAQLPVKEFGKESAMPLSQEPGGPPHEVIESSGTVTDPASRPDARLISREAVPEPYANNATFFSVSPEVRLNFPESRFEAREASAGDSLPVVNPGELISSHVGPLRPPRVITQDSGLNSAYDEAAAAAPLRSRREPRSPSGKWAAETGAASVFKNQEKKLSSGSEPEGRQVAPPITTRKAQAPLRGPMPPSEPVQFPETPLRLRERKHDEREKALELNFPMAKRAASGPGVGRQEETLPSVVHVSIGRIEVRAATAPERPRKERPTASSSSALENYLSRRGGGAQ